MRQNPSPPLLQLLEFLLELFGEQLDTATFERTFAEATLILVAYLFVVLTIAAVSFTRRDVAS